VLAGGGVFALYALSIAFDLLGPAKLGVVLGTAVVLYRFHAPIYRVITGWVIAASTGRRRWAVAGLSIALYLLCPIWGWRLKVADMTPGAPLPFAHHPYNVPYAKLNEEFLFAGGLFGVLAAVNEAVESSYWMTLALVMVAVAACLYLTYGSLVAVGILMIPVVLSQLACEAFMYLWQIDLNVNSLPIAA